MYRKEPTSVPVPKPKPVLVPKPKSVLVPKPKPVLVPKPKPFQPIKPKPVQPVPKPKPSATVEFQLRLTTDDDPTETGWKLTRNDTSPSTLIMQKTAGFYTAKNQSYMEKVLIEKGYYIFTITDSWGDGLTNGASGKYSVQVGGYPFYTGRDFEYEEKLPFFVFL